jgi:hypothetical protein
MTGAADFVFSTGAVDFVLPIGAADLVLMMGAGDFVLSACAAETAPGERSVTRSTSGRPAIQSGSRESVRGAPATTITRVEPSAPVPIESAERTVAPRRDTSTEMRTRTSGAPVVWIARSRSSSAEKVPIPLLGELAESCGAGFPHPLLDGGRKRSLLV